MEYVFWKNRVQMRQRVIGRLRVGGGLQVPLGLGLMVGIYILSVLVLHETLLVLVPIYGNEILLWKEKSRIRAV